MNPTENNITPIVLKHYSNTQAIYLFGTYGTEDEWEESDVDLAILLPPKQAKEKKNMDLWDLREDLETLLDKTVDLINLRMVPTVLQKEIVMADRRIYTGDLYAAEEFEMLTLSYYQKLNEERKEIIEDALQTGRFYKV